MAGWHQSMVARAAAVELQRRLARSAGLLSQDFGAYDDASI